MRAVVTGASGFIGGAAARALLAAGHQVAALARPDSDLSALGGQVRELRGQLAEPQGYQAALTDFAPDAVIHCAWDGVAGAERGEALRQAGNFTATLGLVEAARLAGARHWIGLGSQAEYGPVDHAISEDTPTRPNTLYGAVKLAAGQAAATASALAGMRFAWIRVFAVFGPGDTPTFLVPWLMDTLLRRQRPSLSAGSQIWDLLHVNDAARAILHVAERADLDGVFVLGSGQGRPVRRIAEDIRDAIDPTLELGLGEKPMAAGAPTHLLAEIGRLVRSGWTPALSWPEGLAATLAWHRAKLSEPPCAS